jgi:hypothetical protein
MFTSPMTNSTINTLPKKQQSPYPPQSFYEITFLVLARYMPIQALYVPIYTPIIPVKSTTTPEPSLKSASQRLACLAGPFFVLAFVKILCFGNKEHFHCICYISMVTS